MGFRITYILIIIFSTSILYAGEGKYPAQWWENPNVDNPPSWEILPHQAGPGEVILSKRTELGVLSNFAATPFVLNGKEYASLEGFWQMMKYPEGPDDRRILFQGLKWIYTREEVSQMVGFEAKKAGELASENMEKMDINLVSFEGRWLPYRVHRKGKHYNLIFKATIEKIRQNKKARDILLATGNLILKPDHKQKDPPPAWKYYEILTEIRTELKRGGLND